MSHRRCDARHGLSWLLLAMSLVAGAQFSLRSANAGITKLDFDPWQLRRSEGWRDQVGGGVHGIAVDRDRLYAAVGGRLHVYDVADPSRPLRLGRSTPFLAANLSAEAPNQHAGEVIMVAHANGVYATDAGLGLIGIDVSDASSPRMVAADNSGGLTNLQQLFVSGDDLLETHPDSIGRLIEWWSIPQPAGVTFRIASDFAGIDAQPIAVRSRDLAAVGFQDAAGALGSRRLNWFQLDPSNRRYAPLGSVDLDADAVVESMQLGDRVAVVLQGSRTNGLGAMSLSLIDVVDPTHMSIEATLPISATSWSNPDPRPAASFVRTNAEVVADDSHAYVPIAPDDTPWIASIDLRDPTHPLLVGSALLHGNAGELNLQVNRLYVSSQFDLATTHADPPASYSGAEIFDLTDPAHPRPVGAIDDAWNAIDVAAIGTNAFVAAAASGLRVVDVADRSNAVEIAALPSIGDVTAVRSLGGEMIVLTVASGAQQGVVVVDVADPRAPRIAGRAAIAQHGELADLAVVGSLAMAVSFDGFVHLVDLADPNAPRLVKTLDAAPQPDVPFPPHDPVRESLFARAIAAQGSIAYVGVTRGDEQAAWVVSIDVSVPAAAHVIATTAVSANDPLVNPFVDIYDVAIDEDRVAVATSRDVRLFRSGVGGILQVIGRYRPDFGEARAVAWRGNTIVVACQLGQDVADVSTPASPRRLISRVQFPSAASPWRRHDGIAFLADGAVLQAHGTQGLLISDPVPLASPPDVSPSAPATETPSAPTASAPSTATGTATATLTSTAVPPTAVGPSPAPSSTGTLMPAATSTPPGPGDPATATRTPSPAPSRQTTADRPTAAASPTRPSGGPSQIFLPLTITEACPPKNFFVDVVLVIDASTSMREQVADGRRKIDVVLSAVRAFASGMRLTGGQDRAALVTFNAGAMVVQPLTDQRARIEAALGRVEIAQQSRVDLGVDRAALELLVHGRPGRGQAMVVLSDGLVNPVSSAVAVAAAVRARQQGVTVWVVGLGPILDEQTLLAMASGAERYQRADDVLHVEALYNDLTRRVPCTGDRYWSGR